MSDRDRNLTFSQRYGFDELPKQMNLYELSPDFRIEMWNVIWRFLDTDKKSSRYKIHAPLMRRVMGKLTRRSEDEVDLHRKEIEMLLRTTFRKDPAPTVFRVIETLANEVDEDMHDTLLKQMEQLFDTHQAAYWLDLEKKPYRIFARTSIEESEAVEASIEKIKKFGFEAALSHLRQAKEHIHSQQFSDAIHDSISAVESVARSIAPHATSLDEALKTLEDRGILRHKAFRGAITKLYGYTSNQQGIRHALITESEADVGLPEAFFFYGACAAFSGYLATIGNKR